jgi:hypothetical protein
VLVPLVFVLIYYCYLSQLYATLCGYVNRPLGPLYIVIPCVNIISMPSLLALLSITHIGASIWNMHDHVVTMDPPPAPAPSLYLNQIKKTPPWIVLRLCGCALKFEPWLPREFQQFPSLTLYPVQCDTFGTWTNLYWSSSILSNCYLLIAIVLVLSPWG